MRDIDWISSWASSIIVAVIIGTIIEMIIPEGNSKKFIKMVIGVYVVFTIVTPVITKITGRELEVSDILDLDTYIEQAEESINSQNTIQKSNEDSIKSIYLSSLENDMKAKIEGKGYTVKEISIDVANDENYTIRSINLFIQEKQDVQDTEINISDKIEPVNKIENIEIGQQNELVEDEQISNDTSSSEKKDLKEYLNTIYEVPIENININE